MKGSSLRAQLLLHQWPYLSLQNEIMFRHYPSFHYLRPVVPGCSIETVLTDLHNQLGHCGQQRTEQAIRYRFWLTQLRLSTHFFTNRFQHAPPLNRPPHPSTHRNNPLPPVFPVNASV
uniref:Retrovirus-related Pol polyprotein from transposon 412 n=1 Tax=Schistocephalus solidus TaxID=70667 RepID=A0A0X3PK55_SCHSO